jgi:hypothetical protein
MSELYSPWTDHKENTISDSSIVVWRHYWDGPQRKQQFLPLLRCLATIVNKYFHCLLLTYSVHVTLSYFVYYSIHKRFCFHIIFQACFCFLCTLLGGSVTLFHSQIWTTRSDFLLYDIQREREREVLQLYCICVFVIVWLIPHPTVIWLTLDPGNVM